LTIQDQFRQRKMMLKVVKKLLKHNNIFLLIQKLAFSPKPQIMTTLLISKATSWFSKEGSS
jgi:hypothetical protein